MNAPQLSEGELHQLETDVATRINFAQLLREDVPMLHRIQRALAELKVRRSASRQER